MPRGYRCILNERDGDTITIWLNQPDRLNVLTLSMMEELIQAIADAGRSDATGVVLAAKGRLYCAGHDFTEMAGQDLASVRHLFDICTQMMESIQSIPQPVIAGPAANWSPRPTWPSPPRRPRSALPAAEADSSARPRWSPSDGPSDASVLSRWR
jgi:1,4-dihydroxy-2-naphthoyl-CoA synthase